MNNIDLEKQIINLIPSQTIKNAIYEQNYKFNDLEYVQIVMEFSNSWKRRLDLLNSIKENIDSRDIISYIEAYVKSEINAYNKLIEKEDNYVYDVITNYQLNYDGERYLCSSFDSIMKVIDSFKENYREFSDVDILKHIKLIKRKISNWETPQEIDTYSDIDVYFNKNEEINYIYYGDYIDPEDYNLNMKAIKYPTIFKAGDFVYIDKSKYNHQVRNYTDYYYLISRDKIYGIIGFDQNIVDEEGDIDISYFLNLSDEFVYHRTIGKTEQQYINYLGSHEHIDFGYIEKVNLNDVHSEIKEDYEYTKAKLIELGIIK